MPGAEVSQRRGALRRRRSPPARARPRGPASRRARAGADHDDVGVELPPDSVTTRCTRPVALEARQPVAAVTNSIAVRPRARPGRSAPPRCRSRRSSGTSSSITIVHRLPSAVSDAATSHADVGAADQHHALGVRRRPRGSRPRCRACAGSGCPRARRPRRAAAGRWRPWRAAPGRSPPPPWWTASADALAGSSFITLVRVSSSMSAPPTTRRARNSASSRSTPRRCR